MLVVLTQHTFFFFDPSSSSSVLEDAVTEGGAKLGPALKILLSNKFPVALGKSSIGPELILVAG